jgi:signal transduction histidine kinase
MTPRALPFATNTPAAGQHRSSQTPARAAHRLRAAAGRIGSARLTTFVSDRSSSQRCFVAYAAHELRGEIALQLALAEATLADPDADAAALREMGNGVVAACERQEQLLEALLTLARSEYGLLRREPVDLAATAAEVLRAHGHRELTSTTALEPARTTGDPLLVKRLVANLVENAIRHNMPAGRLDLATYTASGQAIFTIANTGPVIPAGELTLLFEPFQRRSSREGCSADGVGLGLAIVEAIASAHDAMVNAESPTGGGLRIAIGFPAAAWAQPLVA